MALLRNLFVQADRMRFSNIYNVIEQKLCITNETNGTTREFSIPKGKYSLDRLQNILNSFSDEIQFEFLAEKSKLEGSILLKNKSAEFDFLIKMNKNLLLLTGFLDNISMSRGDSSCFLPLPREFIHKGYFDLTRSITEITLYSNFLFDHKTEICCKIMSKKELICLGENENGYGNSFQSAVLNAKQLKTDRCDIESVTFFSLIILNSQYTLISVNCISFFQIEINLIIFRRAQALILRVTQILLNQKNLERKRSFF